MADENTDIQQNGQEEVTPQQQGITFEDILPWGTTGGDTGLSSRLKLKRNFDKIKAWMNTFGSNTYLRTDFFDRLFWVHGTKTYQTEVEDPDTGEPTITTVTENIKLSPNQWPESGGGIIYTITDIEARYGLWTNHFLSALGKNPSGGEGSASHLGDLLDVSLPNPLTQADDGKVLTFDFLTGKWEARTVGSGGGSGTVTQVKIGNTAYSPVNGVVSLPAYPTTLPASDVSAWAKEPNKPSYAFSEITSRPTTLSGYGITDAKIANGVITLGSNTITPVTSVAMTVPTGFSISGSPISKTGTLGLSYATGYEGFTTELKNKINEIYSWFELDADGNVKTKDKPNNGGHRGFWTESFISALGLSDSGGQTVLNEPLNSINNAGLASHPSASGQTIVWNGSAWVYGTAGGGSITAGTGLTGGTSTGTIAINSTYQTYISHGETAYGWGNHALAGYALSSNVYTKTEADAKFMTIAAFENLFNALNSSNAKVSHPYSSSVASIKAMFGLWTEHYLSALGLSDSQGGGGIDWDALAANTNEQINVSHLTNALVPYALTSQIPTSLKNPYKLTITLNGTATEYDGSVARSLTINTGLDQTALTTYLSSKILTVKNGTATLGTWNPTAAGTIDIASALTDVVIYKNVGTGSVDGMSGSFFFGGNNAIQSGFDYAGFQAGYELDKWQMTAIDSLRWRQNDNGGSDASNWTDWRTILDSGNTSITGNTVKINNVTLQVSSSYDLPTPGTFTSGYWHRLGNYVTAGDSQVFYIDIYDGTGYNAEAEQNSIARIVIKDGYQSTRAAANSVGVSIERFGYFFDLKVSIVATAHNAGALWVYLPWQYAAGTYTVGGRYTSWEHHAGTDGDTSTAPVTNQTLNTSNSHSYLYYDNAYLTSNVASATKLQTTRYIWGNAFDGTADINGNLYMLNERSIIIKDTSSVDQNVFTYNSSNNIVIGWGPRATSNTYITGNTVSIARNGGANGFYLNTSNNIGLGGTGDSSHKLYVQGSTLIKHNGGESITLDTTTTYNCIVYQINTASKWSVGTDSNGTFYWYTQPGGNRTVMSLTSAGILNVSNSVKCTDLWIGDIHITYDSTNGGIHVANGGLSANTYVSALGLGDSGGSAFDESAMWQALGTTISAKNIALAYIRTAADTRYALKTDIPTLSTLSWSYGSVTSASNSSYNGSATRSFVIPKATSHLTNDSGFITSSALGSYLPLSGGALSGNISIRATHDLSASNNGVSGELWRGYYINDKDGRLSAQFVNGIYPSGSNVVWMGVRNYNTAGTQIADYGIGLAVDKNGNASYTVSQPAAFRTAIDALSKTEIAGYTWWGRTLNNGVVNGDMTGVGNITMSGDLNMNDGSYVKFKIGNDYTSALGVWGTGYEILNLGYYTTLNKSYATNIYGNRIRLFGSASALGIFINTNGNVGIGTQSPSYKLDVAGNMGCTGSIYQTGHLFMHAGSTGIYLNSDGTGIDWHNASNTYVSSLLAFNQTQVAVAASGGLRIGHAVLIYDSGSNSLKVQHENGGAVNVYATGGVSALGMSGNADGTISGNLLPSTTTTYTIGSSSYKWKSLYLGNGSSSLTIAPTTYAAYFGTTTYFSFSGRMEIDESLYVEDRINIGGTSSSYALYVSGGSYFTGNISAASVTNRSDMRMKDFVENLELSVEAVATAPCFRYTFKNGDGRLMAGTSAQYWRGVLPETVFADSDNMLSLDYGVTALAGVISVARKMMSHEERIAALEKENERLRNEIETLKAA